MKNTLFAAFILAATLLSFFAPQLLISKISFNATHSQDVKY